MKKRRLERCKGLLQRLTVACARSLVFSDEKIFTLHRAFNSQNERIIGDSLADATAKGRLQEGAKRPQSVMVWGVTSSGKTLVFVEAGVKVNAAVYKDILEKELKPWADSHFEEAYWCFQEDSAPAHKAQVVQEWCAEQLPDVITHDLWPSSSPYLNPMDYSACAALEKKACSTRHPNLDSLKEALLKSRNEIDEPYLRATCEAFVERLKDCVEAEGDHFENC
ncbi:unnamed protein product [Heligmosomoides polygyrus]|uniref:DDE_3 domain-containing protein n=1 Tax=Heligmosomoides polygyrus TaxID=6339 RepID=A0A183F5L1_HELPZ|nr:unnamed protein product [Heligmosomoides polygyrus]